MRESADGPERAATEKAEPAGRVTASGAKTASRTRTATARLIGLQRSAGNRAVAGLLAPSRVDVPVVVQRVAAQLGMATDGVTIENLTVRGRPPSPHKGTMGDHTTAYIVQVTAVRRAVLGKTVPAAVAGIQALVAGAANLPGTARSANLQRGGGVGHGDRLDDAAARMQTLSADLTAIGARHARSLTTLQHLVTAYLAYRELIPLTTLNIREISAGLAGRGKGEAGPADDLKQHATLPPAKVAELITKLLDTVGVALLATQPAETAAKVAPGADLTDRVKPILRQHTRAIDAAYPGAILKAWPGGEPVAVFELKKVVKPLIVAEKKKNVDLANKDLLAAFNERIAYQANLVVGGSSSSGALAVIENKIAYCTGIVAANGGTPVVDPATLKAAKRVSKPPDRLVPGGGGGTKRKAPDPKPDPDPDPKPDPNAELTNEGAGSPTATQLTIGPDGRITEVFTEGRPPSPPSFSGKMGAHTTAWIAHKDVIRTTLVGCLIPQAAAKLPELGKGIDDMADRLKVFGTLAGRVSMEAAMRTKAKAVMAAAVTPVAPLLVQDAVAQMLADINLLPGVAFNVANTNGDVEGAYRGVLLQHERDGTGKVAELQLALVGLLDLRSVESEAKKKVLVTNHQVLVTEAYPRSCADSGVATMSIPRLLRLYERKEVDTAIRRKTD